MENMIYFFALISIFVTGGISKGCQLCMQKVCTPSMTGISATDFNPATDSSEINKALQGLSTDDNTLISILTSRSASQRQVIVEEYIKLKHNLPKDFSKNLTGRFKKIMVALVTPLVTFYTKQLRKAIKNHKRLVIGEILATLSPCMIRQVSIRYQELYEKHMYDDLNQFKLSDAVRRSNKGFIAVVQSLAQGDRGESMEVNLMDSVSNAKRLKAAGVDRQVPNEAVFVEIFTKSPIPQLAETLRMYEIMRKQDNNFESLQKDIERVFRTVHLREVYMTIARNTLDQPLYFAQELDKMLGKYMFSSEEDDRIIRIVRGRGDIDMEDIKKAYEREFKKTLIERIHKGFLINLRFPKTLIGIISGTQ